MPVWLAKWRLFHLRGKLWKSQLVRSILFLEFTKNLDEPGKLIILKVRDEYNLDTITIYVDSKFLSQQGEWITSFSYVFWVISSAFRHWSDYSIQ
jgi:hypothetical protein